jgi:hypothetical protein
LEIERIDERLAMANQPLDLAFSLESIRDFVADKTLDLKAAFDAEAVRAKEILACHIDQLILTPRETGEGSVYDVSENIDLFGGDGKAMSLLADACSGRSTKKTAQRAASEPVFDEATVCNGVVARDGIGYTLTGERQADVAGSFGAGAKRCGNERAVGGKCPHGRSGALSSDVTAAAGVELRQLLWLRMPAERKQKWRKSRDPG